MGADVDGAPLGAADGDVVGVLVGAAVGFVVGDVVGACANTDAPKPTTTTHRYRKGAPIDGAARARSL